MSPFYHHNLKKIVAVRYIWKKILAIQWVSESLHHRIIFLLLFFQKIVFVMKVGALRKKSTYIIKSWNYQAVFREQKIGSSIKNKVPFFFEIVKKVILKSCLQLKVIFRFEMTAPTKLLFSRLFMVLAVQEY